LKEEGGRVEWRSISFKNGTLHLTGKWREDGNVFYNVFGDFTTDRDFGSFVGGEIGVVGRRYLLLFEPAFFLEKRDWRSDLFAGFRVGSLSFGGNYRRLESRSKIFPAVRLVSRRWRGHLLFTKDVAESSVAFFFTKNYGLGANYYWLYGEERFYLSLEIYF
jgi:hypothetical protein